MEKAMQKRGQRGFSTIELMIVVLVSLVIAALSIPSFQRIEQFLRIAGDSRNLFAIVSQAKMQAASQFTHARARLGLSSNQYGIEMWDRTNSVWTLVGGIQTLSQNITPGFGSLNTSNTPTTTLTTLAQAPFCLTTAPGAATPAYSSTDVCIEFNSRGIPVNSSGAPTGTNAFFITDGNSVSGITVTISGLIQNWGANIASAQWQRR